MGIYEKLPGKAGDQNPLDTTPGRNDTYGDRFVMPIGAAGNFAQAAEGTYLSFCSPTAGTGVVGNVSTALTATAPYLVIQNGEQTKSFYLDFIRLTVSVITGSDTRVQFTHLIDSALRYSSGGTAMTFNNTNSAVSTPSTVTGYQGAITATAATASRQIAHTIAKGANIDVVWDIYQFQYGSGVLVPAGATITSSQITTAFNLPPIAIGPGHSFLLYEWAASQATGPTFIVEGGGWLR